MNFKWFIPNVLHSCSDNLLQNRLCPAGLINPSLHHPQITTFGATASNLNHLAREKWVPYGKIYEMNVHYSSNIKTTYNQSLLDHRWTKQGCFENASFVSIDLLEHVLVKVLGPPAGTLIVTRSTGLIAKVPLPTWKSENAMEHMTPTQNHPKQLLKGQFKRSFKNYN